MILPDFILPSRVNQHWQYSGIDSIDQCVDKKWFKQYPHTIYYDYNSRGFRDQEWPNDYKELKNSIWCVGDSFTVGLGSPVEHTWTWLLQNHTNTRTINVSMDGASNNWISRKAVDILTNIRPKHMVIHWSYVSRREETLEVATENRWNKFYSNIRDSSWPDCDVGNIKNLPKFIVDEIETIHGGFPVTSDDSRLLRACKCSHEEDIENTLTCIQLVNQYSNSTKIIHSFIPGFSPKEFKEIITTQAMRIASMIIPEIQYLDRARDGHHYDIKTSQAFVNQIISYLNLKF